MGKIVDRFYIVDSLLRFDSTNYLKVPRTIGLDGVKRTLLRRKKYPIEQHRSRGEKLRYVENIKDVIIESVIKGYEIVKTLTIDEQVLVLKQMEADFSECLLMLKEYLGFSIESLSDVTVQEIERQIAENKDCYEEKEKRYRENAFRDIFTEEELKKSEAFNIEAIKHINSIARADIINNRRLNYEKEISILSSLEGLGNEIIDAINLSQSQREFIHRAIKKEEPHITLLDFIAIDDEQGMLYIISRLFMGKKGKKVAIAIEALQKMQLLSINNGEYAKFYNALRHAGYDIGSDQAINKQLSRSSQSSITKEEMAGAVQLIKSILGEENELLGLSQPKTI